MTIAPDSLLEPAPKLYCDEQMHRSVKLADVQCKVCRRCFCNDCGFRHTKGWHTEEGKINKG